MLHQDTSTSDVCSDGFLFDGGSLLQFLADGSVVTWSHAGFGGDRWQLEISSGVRQIRKGRRGTH